jgi:hypothetical protein
MRQNDASKAVASVERRRGRESNNINYKFTLLMRG